MNNSNEILKKAFPVFLANDVLKLLEKIDLKSEFHLSEGFTVSLNNELIVIPYRIYFEEPDERNLSKTELTILNCIFTRHFNGFIRQNRVERMLQSDEFWISPFIIKLLGEYVIEILVTIENNLNDKLIEHLACFSKENPKFLETTKRRIVSYWNCYYRTQFPNIENYVGFKILKEIEKFSIS
ncbi:MAG: hypothetical protein M3209_06620 [Acidobacteriota bacterium]|nr:hypothetical protein [Acidobacteriota bacterium]